MRQPRRRRRTGSLPIFPSALHCGLLRSPGEGNMTAAAHTVSGRTDQLDGRRTIVVVDDHPLMRDGLRLFLGQLPRWRLVGEASTAREGLAQVDQHVPDVVL